jgi:hypothetical protein
MGRKLDSTLPPVQALIRKKFWGEMIMEGRKRLCRKCIFKVQHHAPCRLLPITSEGKDCQYFNLGDQDPKEVEWNG